MIAATQMKNQKLHRRTSPKSVVIESIALSFALSVARPGCLTAHSATRSRRGGGADPECLNQGRELGAFGRLRSPDAPSLDAHRHAHAMISGGKADGRCPRRH